MSKSLGNMVFVRDALASTTPQALRLYLLDLHYRRAFDHNERRLAAARKRSAALVASLGSGRVGPLASDAATREVLAALDDDLDTRTAIRRLERATRVADDTTKRSLRHVAREILGVL